MNDELQQSWWKWALFGIAGFAGFQVAATLADRGLKKSLAARKNGSRRKSKSLAKACWPGYEAYGTKMKGSRRVPNCVPKRGRDV